MTGFAEERHDAAAGQGQSAEAAAITLGHLLRRVHHVGHEATLHSLPAFLDGDVTPFDKLKDVTCQLCESPFDVNSVTRWRFHVAHAIGGRQLFRFLLAHLPLRLQVTLVAHQQEDDAVRLHVAARLLQPLMNILEGATISDVKQQQATHWITVVSPGDRPEERDIEQIRTYQTPK